MVPFSFACLETCLSELDRQFRYDYFNTLVKPLGKLLQRLPTTIKHLLQFLRHTSTFQPSYISNYLCPQIPQAFSPSPNSSSHHPHPQGGPGASRHPRRPQRPARPPGRRGALPAAPAAARGAGGVAEEMAGGVDAATDQLESGGKVGGNLGGYIRQLLDASGRWGQVVSEGSQIWG